MKFTASLLALLLACSTVKAEDKQAPPFFLQDPTDSLCLAGETFKRCSIDTLFYVTGAQGMKQKHYNKHAMQFVPYVSVCLVLTEPCLLLFLLLFLTSIMHNRSDLNFFFFVMMVSFGCSATHPTTNTHKSW